MPGDAAILESGPVLAMDTSMGACSAAVAVAGAVTARRLAACRSGHSELLMGMIADVLAEAGLTYADIARLAVTVGPGSFTGVRIGLAAARALALSLDKPLIGVTTLEAMATDAAKAHHLAEGTRLQLLIDARRGEAYGQDFLCGANWPDLTPASAPRLVTVADFRSQPLPDVRAGSAAALVADDGARILEGPEAPDAAVVALMAASRPVPAPYAAPGPLYLRAPDAKLPAEATAR